MKKALRRAFFLVRFRNPVANSSAFHAVTPAESFTGAGNVFARTLRHKVDAEKGSTPAGSCAWRTKPV